MEVTRSKVVSVVRVVGVPSQSKGAVCKPRITLVRAPLVSSLRSLNNEATPSLGFAYLSAYLMARGYSVSWVDGIGQGLNKVWPLADYPGYQCQGLTFEQIVESIPADTEIIGFSAMFSGEWPILRDLIKRVRKRFPKCLMLAGGEHITALTEYALRDCPELDVCVRGEGEQTFYEVAEAFAEGRDFSNINGVGYIDKSGAYVEPEGLTRIRDIDNIPWPYWPDGYLETFWAAGKSYGVLSKRDMPMMVSRGCPFKCTFCSNPGMWTTRYVLRNVDDVIAEIKHHIARYNITAVQLYDLTAIAKRSWAVEFCKRLLSEGIKLNWSLPSGTRSEALDEETLGLLKQTGCNYLVYAPESGSPRTLELIKKQISLEKLTESAMIAKKLGIVLRTNLIIGFPHETRADIFKTVAYGLKLAVKGVDEVSINIFSPYPGTEIFVKLIAEGKVKIEDRYFLALTSLNSDYTVVNPMTVHPTMGSRELAIYRLGFMLTNYALGYLLFPKRITRSIRNIFFEGKSATVFEHRLKDAFKRRMANAGPKQ